ncbi:UbiA family prenyltransferase [Paraglaciecola sp. L3A3]|uniref:UbiA family prenyltransferase n=1 Tax=Paraglaciecola sp. L3A3 TaxID=2686358 RepID=UPI00131C3886|nr:UbiA family prenyltransferase [Paraglaciecola sp. L3A3]
MNRRADTLYVDLDGTFIKSDILFESFISAFKKRPIIIFLCFLWLLKGRAYLKDRLAIYSDINVNLLSKNSEFYAYLLEQKKLDRHIVLATASNQKYAEQICNNSEVLDDYISSDDKNNLKGKNKLDKIQSIASEFSYAGNSTEDFILFKHAQESILVNPSTKAKKLSIKSPTDLTFDVTQKSMKIWFKQLRIHQWLKNLLIFVPLLVSGLFFDVPKLIDVLLGFISFSCLASATYIINDLLDLESDRSHPRKCKRPLAASSISINKAIHCSLFLLFISFGLTFFIVSSFLFVLCLYLITTLLYSFCIKKYVGIDVITLASLYTIRIIAGSVILQVTTSFWLLSFSMFVFLSLALIKRCSELKSFEMNNQTHANGRDYNTADLPILMSFGTASAMLAVLMFCFYVNSNILANQYQEPNILWLILPALCYWLLRMWVKTNRGEMDDDPIVFAIKDTGSMLTIAFIGVIALLAQIL